MAMRQAPLMPKQPVVSILHAPTFPQSIAFSPSPSPEAATASSSSSASSTAASSAAFPMWSNQIQRIHSDDPKFVKANFSNALSDEQMAALRAALTRNTHLQSLVLHRQAFCKSSLLTLLASLEKIPALTKLDLRYCGLNDPCAAAMAQSLRRLGSLIEIDLRENRFTLASGPLFQQAIHAHRRLDWVRLDNGCTTTAQRTMIAACLRRNSLLRLAAPAQSASSARVRTFDHTTTRMSLWEEDWCAAELREILTTRLRRGHPVTSLTCSKPGVRECVVDLVALIQSQPTFASLSVTGCAFHGEPFKQLMHSLCDDTHILMLDLQNNGLVDDDAAAIADMLARNRTLHWLDIRMNGISDSGYAALFSALDHNPTLTRLEMSSNPHRAFIERKLETRRIARIQRNDPEFTKAEFTSEIASREDFVPLCQALSTNTHLESFEMNSPAVLDARSLAQLLAALQRIPALTYLKLQGHDFNDECGLLIADALPRLGSLAKLILIGNRFTKATAARFVQAVQLHSRLGYLNLRGDQAINISQDDQVRLKLERNRESAAAAEAAVFEDSSPASPSIVTSPSSGSSSIATREREAAAAQVARKREAASAAAASGTPAAAETLTLQRLEMMERCTVREAAERARAEEAARFKAEMEEKTARVPAPAAPGSLAASVLAAEQDRLRRAALSDTAPSSGIISVPVAASSSSVVSASLPTTMHLPSRPGASEAQSASTPTPSELAFLSVITSAIAPEAMQHMVGSLSSMPPIDSLQQQLLSVESRLSAHASVLTPLHSQLQAEQRNLRLLICIHSNAAARAYYQHACLLLYCAHTGAAAFRSGNIAGESSFKLSAGKRAAEQLPAMILSRLGKEVEKIPFFGTGVAMLSALVAAPSERSVNQRMQRIMDLACLPDEINAWIRALARKLTVLQWMDVRDEPRLVQLTQADTFRQRISDAIGKAAAQAMYIVKGERLLRPAQKKALSDVEDLLEAVTATEQFDLSGAHDVRADPLRWGEHVADRCVRALWHGKASYDEELCMPAELANAVAAAIPATSAASSPLKVASLGGHSFAASSSSSSPVVFLSPSSAPLSPTSIDAAAFLAMQAELAAMRAEKAQREAVESERQAKIEAQQAEMDRLKAEQTKRDAVQAALQAETTRLKAEQIAHRAALKKLQDDAAANSAVDAGGGQQYAASSVASPKSPQQLQKQAELEKLATQRELAETRALVQQLTAHWSSRATEPHTRPPLPPPSPLPLSLVSGRPRRIRVRSQLCRSMWRRGSCPILSCFSSISVKPPMRSGWTWLSHS